MSLRSSCFAFSSLLIVLSLFTTCQQNAEPNRPDTNECATCNLPLSTSEQSTHSTTTSSSGSDIGGEVSINATLVKKLVAGEINLGGGYQQGQTSSETVYKRIVNNNPEIVQSTNLYRNIACALLQIVCEDPTITEEEKQLEKRALINEYKAKVDQILSLDKPTVKPSTPTSRTTRASIPSSNSDMEVQVSSSPSRTNYFTSKSFSPLAILAVGDKSYLDLSQSLRSYCTEQGIQTSNGMLKPAFWSQFRSRIRALDTEVFQEVAANEHTNCICILDQSVSVREGSLAGEKIITGIGNVQAWLFNLKTGEVGQMTFEQRGAGMTINRAMEDLERKLRDEYPNAGLNFSACR